jgi:hypothetical protein
MNKHTPGPWSINGQSANGEITIGHEEMRVVIASAHNAVSCGDVIFGRHPREQWANARLIAASPDLLASLVEILPMASFLLRDTNPYREEVLERARAAITRATGNQQ